MPECSAGKQKQIPSTCLKSNIKNWDPSATSLECFVLTAGGSPFQALHPSQQVMQWSSAAGGTLFLPHPREMSCTLLWSPYCSSVSPAVKKVDPVYCKAELIPHHKRLWDSGQENFIINTDKLLTSYIQPMMHGLWCQGGCWLPSKTQTIQEPNLLSDFFLCVTKLAAFLWTDTHIPPPLPMSQIIRSSNSLEPFRELEIVIKKININST